MFIKLVYNYIHVQECSQPQSDTRAHVFYIPINFMVVNYWHVVSNVHSLRVSYMCLLIIVA